MTDELIGRWSVEHGYHSAMEDEELVFKPNGAGWVAWLRPGVIDFTTFRWRRTGPGRVHLTPTRSAWAEGYADGGPVLEEHEVPAAVEVEYRLSLGKRPLRDHALVLRLDLPFRVLSASFALAGRGTPEADVPPLPWD